MPDKSSGTITRGIYPEHAHEDAKEQARASEHGKTMDATVRTAALTARFKEIDANNDGFISLTEWETWCKAHPHKGAKGGSQQTPTTSGSTTAGPTLK